MTFTVLNNEKKAWSPLAVPSVQYKARLWKDFDFFFKTSKTYSKKHLSSLFNVR